MSVPDTAAPPPRVPALIAPGMLRTAFRAGSCARRNVPLIPRQVFHSKSGVSPSPGRVSVGVGPCVGLCLLCNAAPAHAEPPRLGPDISGSAGYFRVPVVALAARGLDVGGGVGYGYTEPLSAAPGSHHRIRGRVTASLTPLEWLGLSWGSNLRHDRHPGDPLGPDTGTVLDSDVLLRAGWRWADAFHVGLGAGAWFTRGSSMGESLEKPSLGALALAAWVPEDGPLSLGIMAGYRYDPSAALIDDPERYRSGDRLALGLSSFDAVPLGIGAAYRVGDAELVAELSADALVGAGAPDLSRSPLRASAGARYHVSDSVALRLLTDTSLSGRPPSGAGDALLPVEPRFQVLFGMSCRLLSWEASAPVEPEPAPSPPPPPTPAALATLEVSVTTADGYPLSDANLSLEVDGRSLPVPHVEMQIYRVGQLPTGKARLRVEAERLEPQLIDIDLSAQQPNLIRVQLKAATMDGQVRGVVRSVDGSAIAATVRIEPLGTRLTADGDGAFQLDLPPGKYEVVIEARGHLTQRRSIEVRADGVVVLNADLLRSSP
jgi:hypothetical protein